MFSITPGTVSWFHSQKWSPITSRGGPGLTLKVLPKKSRSSHLIWELMQCLIQYVAQMMSLHSKNASQLHLPSVWLPSRWANTTFQQMRLEWSRWRATIMGSLGNGPIRTHLILMQNSNVSGLLGLGRGSYSLSDFGLMFWLGLKEAVQILLQTHRGDQHSSPRFTGQVQRESDSYSLAWRITDMAVHANILTSFGFVVFHSCGEVETGLL